MGFFEGLDTEKYDRQYTDRELTRRIVGYFKVMRSRMILIIVLTVALSAVMAALPVVVSRVIGLIAEQPVLPLETILLVGLGVALVGVLEYGLNWARRSLTQRAVGDVVLTLRTQAFRAAAEHDLSFYDQFSSGRIVSRITSDTNDFGQLIVIITDIAAQIFQAVLLGVILWRTRGR
jgi:ATP-binding cassette subfamily B protein